MDSTKSKSATRQAMLLILFGIFTWVLLLGPAWLLAEFDGVVGLSISGAVCILPGCAALWIKVIFSPQSHVFFLISSGLRFGLVLASALIAKSQRPELGIKQFYIWLIVFYLLALAVETWQVLRRAN